MATDKDNQRATSRSLRNKVSCFIYQYRFHLEETAFSSFRKSYLALFELAQNQQLMELKSDQVLTDAYLQIPYAYIVSLPHYRILEKKKKSSGISASKYYGTLEDHYGD